MFTKTENFYRTFGKNFVFEYNKTMFYRFCADGRVEKVVSTKKTFSELDDYDTLHHLICVSEIMFFATHTDNDFSSSYKETTLPINQAVVKYFSNSKIVGDVLLVCLDDEDNLLDCSDLEDLKKYKIEFFSPLEENPVGNFVPID